MRGHVLGFRISGVGQDTQKTDGTIFYMGPSFFNPSNFSALSNYNWIRSLVSTPREDDVSATPGKAEVDLEAYTPKVAMTQTTSQILRARQRRPPLTVDGGIGGQSTDTTLTLKEGANQLNSGDDIYIGDETLRVDSDDGGGDYTVTRAIWDSNIISHGDGAGVYTRPPFYQWRRVTFFTFSYDETLRTPWQGYLKDRSPQMHSTELQLKCESPLSLPMDVEGFRTNPIFSLTFEAESSRIKYVGPSNNSNNSAQDPEEIRSRVAKQKDANGNDQSTWNQKNYPNDPEDGSQVMWGCWRPNSSGEDSGKPRIFPIVKDADEFRKDKQTQSPATNEFRNNGDDRFPDRTRPAFRGSDRQISTGHYSRNALRSMDINEIALWKRSIGKAPYPIADLQQKFDNAWHPVAIASTILCSTNHNQIRPDELDYLNGNIGLGLNWIIDQQSFIDEVNVGSSGLQIDQLILGWAGETEDLFNIVLHLLASYGYFLAPQDDNTIGVAEWGRGDIRDLESAPKLTPAFHDQDDDVWGWKPDGTDGTFVVSGKVGETPVHDEPYSIEYIGLQATNRMNRRTDPDTTEYDHRFLKDNTHGRKLANRYLKAQAEYLAANMPSVRFKAQGNPIRDNNLDFSVGNFVILQQPAEAQPNLGIGQDGGTEDMNSPPRDDKYLGQIVSRGWNPAEDSYELEVLLTNYDRAAGRQRAPAVRVKSYDANNDVVTTYTGTFVSGKEDAQLFAEIEGAQLKLLDGTLEPIDDSSAPQIDTVGTSSNSLNKDQFSLKNATFSTAPKDQDVITIQNYDDFSYTTAGGLRRYAFWADSNNDLGSQNDDGDRWL